MIRNSNISVILFYITALIYLDGYAQTQKVVWSNSSISLAIPEKDLLPESIAYDAAHGDFYVGSTRKGKIVKVSKDGIVSDFIHPKQHGLWMIIGMKIDTERRILWVCSSGGDNLEGYNLKDEKQGRPAGVFKFDLDNGKLIKKYVLNSPGEVHFFNDLIVAKNGDAYVTHMFRDHAIYKIPKNKDVMERVFSSDIIKYPNGITLSKDESKLYIAHSEGIAVIQIPDAKILPIRIPEGLKIAGRASIDGLYYHNNSLIGIQPDIKTVQQFQLNKDGTVISSSKLLEMNHPMMNNPTTGELVGDTLYYIANAQFGSFNEDGSLFSMNKLYEPIILKLHLDDK